MPTDRPSLRPVRRAAPLAALLGLVCVALTACGGDDVPPPAKLSAAQVADVLATTPPQVPPAVRALEEQAGETIDGGQDPSRKLDELVADLKGTPVVVNVWADWCAPCKKEMPIFQRVALQRRGEVAFLGAASRASKADSVAYLAREIALPYPSLIDEPGQLIDGTGVDGLPKTFFFDAAGKRYVHNGPYTSEAALLEDIARYAPAATTPSGGGG